MNIGVIGSGSIGPDLAYGFVSALSRAGGGRVYLHDIRREALDAGLERIRGYVGKGVSRGKISAKAAREIEQTLIPTLELADLAGCDYVLEAATEDLETKRKILARLEQTVRADCLIGFATSGIPRARIAAGAVHPERCFVNHPFFPAWRSLPVEVVLSGDARTGERMLDTLTMLGKIPVVTADVPCFAADDIFCNYCAEAARIVAEGVATPAQVDAIVHQAIGGGGPFNVMDLTQGNLLNVHCLELMQHGPDGSDWFAPPAIFTRQGHKPWIDRKNPGDPTHDAALAERVLDRILAVLLGRTYYVVDHEICNPTELNWLTRTALGFRDGLLDLAASLGADRVREICTSYAASHPGYVVPDSIAERRPLAFHGNVRLDHDGEIAVVTVFRPEVKNALDERTMDELARTFAALAEDDAIRGVVLTSPDGALAGADITELAALATPQEAADKCRRGQAVLDRIATFAKPVVAAVDGPVLGGGAELSMACHARVVGRSLMLGQPEVNLGIIPGYGGTQRLPRLVGVERGQELLRTGRPVGPREACEWGWAHGEPAGKPVAVAKELVRRHLAGEVQLAAVSAAPMDLPERLAPVALGHRSLAVDAILVDTLRRGLTRPLPDGLGVEAENFARCQQTVDYDIGMKNFMQNGPRVPAVFINE
ncbi:MAG TPA: 3-hydroxyacyl-CoA dehydrogenase/enoyl-CoA hydratase family protein [Candidatus Polarisedimenticolaceae bacterium]|nr:3-hydroxyacyl-CoA dehydrogenase/enoyl-CoA hydratase family protein [Candidatus Polarisedimenticolaceae bacterium]